MRSSALVVILLLARSVSASTILTVDYETGTLNSGVMGVSATLPPATDAITISSDYMRSGLYSVRSKVAYNSDYISDGNYRAETNTMAFLPSRYSAGDQDRYRFSLCLDPSWIADTRDSIDIVWQFKRFSSSPDMFVAVKGLDIVLRGQNGYQMTIVKNYQIGQWMDFQLDVNWSPDAEGATAAYYKYATSSSYSYVDTYHGPTMLDGTPANAYLKWGDYKPDFSISNYPQLARIVYHDDISVTALPEPSSAALLATGAAALSFIAWRRKRRGR